MSFKNSNILKFNFLYNFIASILSWNSSELRSSAFQAYNYANAILSACNTLNSYTSKYIFVFSIKIDKDAYPKPFFLFNKSV